MAGNRKNDPYMSFNFIVEIKGLVVGGFSEVSGLQVDVEVEDYREGGVNEFIHRLAGPVKYSTNLSLKRGLMDTHELFDWLQDIRYGNIEPKKISIVLLDEQLNEARRWEFKKAFPVKWTGPELRAGSSTVAVENIEFVHQGMS